MIGQIALISLGSNHSSVFGDPSATVVAAFRLLATIADRPVRQSPLFATPAFPAGSGPDFVNAAAAFETSKPASEILSALHAIEAQAGRTRTIRWGQRTLDLDLLALGDQVAPDAATQDHWRDLPPDAQARVAPDQLILPHPRMQDRSFVLVPLRDIAPDWRHPLLGASVAQMHDRLSLADRATVRRLADPSPNGQE